MSTSAERKAAGQTLRRVLARHNFRADLARLASGEYTVKSSGEYTVKSSAQCLTGPNNSKTNGTRLRDSACTNAD